MYVTERLKRDFIFEKPKTGHFNIYMTRVVEDENINRHVMKKKSNFNITTKRQ